MHKKIVRACMRVHIYTRCHYIVLLLTSTKKERKSTNTYTLFFQNQKTQTEAQLFLTLGKNEAQLFLAVLKFLEGPLFVFFRKV